MLEIARPNSIYSLQAQVTRQKHLLGASLDMLPLYANQSPQDSFNVWIRFINTTRSRMGVSSTEFGIRTDRSAMHCFVPQGVYEDGGTLWSQPANSSQPTIFGASMAFAYTRGVDGEEQIWYPGPSDDTLVARVGLKLSRGFAGGRPTCAVTPSRTDLPIVIYESN